MGIVATDWYDTDPDTTGKYQGDIIHDVPVVFMPHSGERWVLLRPNNLPIEQVKKGSIPGAFKPFTEKYASAPWSDGTDVVVALATKQPVMVLTQTCDIDHRKWIQCAPIYIAPRDEQKLQSLAENEITYQFFLPTQGDWQDSYVDLAKVASVHISYVKEARLVMRLSNLARSALQMKLAAFYGRPFGFNTKDDIPQASDYLCTTCFLRGATVQRSALPAMGKFPPCPSCGEAVRWVKFSG